MSQTPQINNVVHCVAEVTSERAGRYLQQLAKHFRHKLPVSFDQESGQITFSVGECRMEARGEQLTLMLTAPDAASMTQLHEVVARHLLRFAFREELQIVWRQA